MTGKLFAVGVGPGDPELLTLKAVKTIKNADCIACPQSRGEPGIAYRVAQGAVPEIASKELLLLDFPMCEDDIKEFHEKAAEQIILRLSKGKNVAFLTLGDPEFYSTFYYIADIIGNNGYDFEIINGITSFSAVSSKLKMPLSLGDESVMITSGKFCDYDGTLVILKVGKNIKEIKEKVSASGRKAYLVENSGMENERVYYDLQSIPDEVGYLSIMIVK
ncbi:MAG: precorrin-2 C(20)-methyltransferase [Lachnospiraceae bacterium]|nr:precorrin-2 C(20)-methyltransferase [Lachnospiraceae bacterium]